MTPTFGARQLGRAGGLLRVDEGVRRKTRKGSKGFHRCGAAKAVYNSDPLASSLWTDARYYPFVFTADGNDLAELLVRNGLARIYGTRTPLRFASAIQIVRPSE